jgi:hypothetical protein
MSVGDGIGHGIVTVELRRWVLLNVDEVLGQQVEREMAWVHDDVGGLLSEIGSGSKN